MDTGSRLLAEVEGGGPPPSSPPPRRPHLGGPWPGLRLTVVAALVLLVAGGISAVVFTSTGGGEALTGRTDARAPAFSLPELTDTARSVSLSQLGGHDVVLNFWASWCYPCTTEMPVLQAAHRSDPRVRFVGIDTNDTRGDALGFLQRVHVSYLTLYDPHGTAAVSYGLIGLPTTVFLSPRGRVLGRHQGQLDAATLGAALHQAFGPGV